MKIEIAKNGKMKLSGSTLLRSLQNNSEPILDILVRESIQNSLDAAKTKTGAVSVEFLTGSFRKDSLNCVLETTEEHFNRRFPDSEYRYLAIRDSNTKGLTGKMDPAEETNNEYGNLTKLVYSIGKPQMEEGAGGSWGLGKTTYYRVGAGLVIFYSRIKLTRGGYESRLAASLIEDERHEDPIVPPCGIAWWGRRKPGTKNQTLPITDEKEIEEILKIFDIPPYTGKETGTTIIIPYINTEDVLNDNPIFEGEKRGPWTGTLEDFVKVAVQRWYAPRLNNKDFPYGGPLTVSINGAPIQTEKMEPVFHLIRTLYFHAVNGKAPKEPDPVYGEIHVDTIDLRDCLEKSRSGAVAYVQVAREALQMCPPYNRFSPLLYCNFEVEDTHLNEPILCFTRQPGMIVSYQNEGKWVNGIEKTDQGHYIIGIFVLNSDNKLKEKYSSVSLEEYIRGSEKADHFDWCDHTLKHMNPRIVDKIQKQVRKKIADCLVPKDDSPKDANFALGRQLANVLMPPEGFGTQPSDSPATPKTPGLPKKRTHSFDIDDAETQYFSSGITIPVHLVFAKDDAAIDVDAVITAGTASISYSDWMDTYGCVPAFDIAKIQFRKVQGKAISGIETIFDASTDEKDLEGITFHPKIASSRMYGFSLEKEPDEAITVDFDITFRIYNRDINIQLKESWTKQ